MLFFDIKVDERSLSRFVEDLLILIFSVNLVRLPVPLYYTPFARILFYNQIQNLITLNDQKINRSKSKVKEFKLHEYSIEQLKKELELNPTDFFVLSQLSKNLIAAKKFKEAIEILKLQVILRPYCRQSYETIFRVQKASR